MALGCLLGATTMRLGKISKDSEIYQTILKSAKKFKRRGHFQINDQLNYMRAYRYRILDEVCSHMKEKHQEIKWDIKSLKKEALSYNTRSEFQNKSQSAYITAYVNGILDEVCSHMKPSLKKIKKLIMKK